MICYILVSIIIKVCHCDCQCKFGVVVAFCCRAFNSECKSLGGRAVRSSKSELVAEASGAGGHALPLLQMPMLDFHSDREHFLYFFRKV